MTMLWDKNDIHDFIALRAPNVLFDEKFPPLNDASYESYYRMSNYCLKPENIDKTHELFKELEEAMDLEGTNFSESMFSHFSKNCFFNLNNSHDFVEKVVKYRKLDISQFDNDPFKTLRMASYRQIPVLCNPISTPFSGDETVSPIDRLATFIHELLNSWENQLLPNSRKFKDKSKTNPFGIGVLVTGRNGNELRIDMENTYFPDMKLVDYELRNSGDLMDRTFLSKPGFDLIMDRCRKVGVEFDFNHDAGFPYEYKMILHQDELCHHLTDCGFPDCESSMKLGFFFITMCEMDDTFRRLLKMSLILE